MSISKFCKEELPTYDEIYNQFYERFSNSNLLYKKMEYSSYHDTELCPYYKQPRRKIILAKMANQLNKYIFEDCNRDELLKMIGDHFNETIIDIRVEVHSKEYDSHSITIDEIDEFPVIYDIPNPYGTFNPFRNNNIKHINIFDENSYFCELMILGVGDSNGLVRFKFDDITEVDYIIESLLKDVIAYYNK